MKKRSLSMLMALLMLCSVFSVSALADGTVAEAETRASSYISGSASVMNSLNGYQSGPKSITASVYSQNAYVTMNVNVSTGSSSFYLILEAPDGRVATKLIRSSGSVTFSEFNGMHPSGKWYVSIMTTGTVSTASASVRINYNY